MFIYRYLSPSDRNFGMLSRGEIFFASREELNDEGEGKPYYVLSGPMEHWERFCEMLFFELSLYMKHDFHGKISEENINQFRLLGSKCGREIKKKIGRQDIPYAKLHELLISIIPRLMPEGNSIGELNTEDLEKFLGRCLFERFNKFLDQPLYVASFSGTCTVPTMWGHYANAGRGFVVIYRVDDDKLNITSRLKIFPSCTPNSQGVYSLGAIDQAQIQLQPIQYRTKRPTLNVFQILCPKYFYSEQESHYDAPVYLADTAPTKEEMLFGLVKYSTWNYEKEFRAIFPALGKYPNPETRVVTLPIDTFQGVIFGPEMTKQAQERVVMAAHLLFSKRPESKQASHENILPFKFFKTYFHKGQYVPRIIPCGSLLEGLDIYGKFFPYKSLIKMPSEEKKKLLLLAKELNEI